jgi:hypothetical protein
VLIRGRDGCVRDMASLHRSYRKVEETMPAIRLIGSTLHELGATPVSWYFDAPISNSGRLRGILYTEAECHGWDWSVELLPNPDKPLAASEEVVATADSWILDRAERWFNLPAHILAEMASPPEVLDLGEAG